MKKPSQEEYEKFWFWYRLSFPLGKYCEEYKRSYEFHENRTPKDCGTCRSLRLGRCTRGHVPNVDVAEGEKDERV